MVELSVVIPAFNESRRISPTLREIRPWLEQHFKSYEVIVVDNGSRDNTAAIVRDFCASWKELRCVEQKKNGGKGAAVRQGCLESSGEVIFYMDADHATPIDELAKFLPFLREGYDMVSGIRAFQDDESRFRRIIGISLQLLAHLFVFNKSVVDSQCAFKCFKGEAARKIFKMSRINGGMFDLEVFYLAHKMNLKIYSVAVHWRNKSGSTINIPRCILLDPFSMLRIPLNNLLGRYGP